MKRVTVPQNESYLVPALKDGSVHRTELTVKKSRFITSVGRARGIDGCRKFVSQISSEFADARHNCFAFNGGKPEDSGSAGCSDDGEPHGTAGQPMLNVVLHCGIGEICCVVTRYFGGILLGTGGLVKAYQDSVKLSLETLPTTPMVIMKSLRIEISPRFVTLCLRLFSECGAEIIEQSYGVNACFRLQIPEKCCDRVVNTITSMSAGSASIFLED